MTKLLTVDNFFKGIGLTIDVCGLYYALDKRLSLIEQKVDYMVDNYKDKEVEAKVELAGLKDTDKEQAKELAEIKLRILRICAVLPRTKLEIENEQD